MYDIIGDIHGYADALEILLQKMGYERTLGVYKHPENRKVAFVGDFIDRGLKIRETLHIVKDMCDSGNAIAIMGNHEYNAICFHTPHTENGGFFRDHSLKEIEQHIDTLRQFKHYQKEWPYFIDWFKTLPMYFENDDFRLVHACWDDKHIQWLKNNYKGITNEFLSLAARRDSEVYKIVEETLKGKESKLPNGLNFTDKDGAIRNECRVKWWAHNDKRKTFGQMMMECPEELSNNEIPEEIEYYRYPDAKPVFFGHYWLKGSPSIESNNAICLDYSVAKGGKLVGYRFNIGNAITIKDFIY
jgi:hypothetical protein